MVTTGNPVRREITDILSPKWRYDEREQAGKPLNILIVGGSLGAKALNERLPPALKQLQVPLNIFHQCGQQQVEATQALYADAPANLTVQVLPFIEDMAKAYSEADLIICRAGALTVTEVATAGVAAVFVPLPIAVDDHQTANAKFLADVGAAKNLPAIDHDTRSFKSIVYYVDEPPIAYRNGSESASTCPTKCNSACG